jgi:hypothetical protein
MIGMPALAAKTSSSRSAIHALPTRESRSMAALAAVRVAPRAAASERMAARLLALRSGYG